MNGRPLKSGTVVALGAGEPLNRGKKWRSRVASRSMACPDRIPLKKLPMLEQRRDALEKCVFCPKLSRSACPVSNAEPRETLTPWGKMSMAYFAGNGSVPMEPSYAAPAWACTGCFACRESCDHKNDVAGTLLVARAGLVENGVAPEAAMRTIARFAAHAEANASGVRTLAAHPGVRSDSRDALLIGCAYLQGGDREATHALEASSALVRGKVAPIDACCGLPLLSAGDRPGFVRQAEAFAHATRNAERILVVDAGCALALRTRYAEVGVTLNASVELVVERAARELERLATVGSPEDEAVRYHDPCQLGRGLGVYEAPRAVLTRLLGRAPSEFVQRRDKAACSGAGALLPVTMPEAAREIARARLSEHEEAGGGRVVTACASSLRAFRKPGNVAVDDIVSWIARGLARPE